MSMSVWPVSLVPSEPEPKPSGQGVCLSDRLWWADTHDAPRAGGAVHEAQDIFAPRGSLVLAPEPSRVIGKGTSAKGGHWLRLFAPRSNRTYYLAHLDAPASVAIGEEVVAGQAVAKVGNTGNARGVCPHLHVRAARGKDRPLEGPEGAVWKRGVAFNLAGELRRLDPYRGSPPAGPLAPELPAPSPEPARPLNVASAAGLAALGFLFLLKRRRRS